jgi:glycosyltransferase involved in cell wall biosynthesis
MNTLSVLVCSYNTPFVLETCLKSWKKYHPNSTVEWLISENSTNNETTQLLNNYSIPCFRNHGMSHAMGVDFLIKQCKTDYALLIDSDVIFHKNIESLWNKIKDIDFVIAGERCGDRGGKLLYPRIHPWFCFLNVKIIKGRGFELGDDDFLNKGKSPGDRLYDVGSKIYDDVIKAGLNIIDMEKDMDSYYYHYEGMSWRKNQNKDIKLREWGLAVDRSYQKEIELHKDIIL